MVFKYLIVLFPIFNTTVRLPILTTRHPYPISQRVDGCPGYNRVVPARIRPAPVKDRFIGNWNDAWGYHFTVRSDSTFLFIWHFDLSSSWSVGRWKANGDTIFFSAITIYDTLRYYDSIRHKRIDSLFVSRNDTSDVVKKLEDRDLFGNQNVLRFPNQLVFRNGKLYRVNKNGKIDRRKPRSLSNARFRFPTWFSRQEN